MTEMSKSPKHGTTNPDTPHDTPKSESQADGTAANAPRGETQAQPDQQNKSAQASGSSRQNPTTAGNPVRSQTPEDREGKINPSAPTNATEGVDQNVAQGSERGAPLNDHFGEAGDPAGRGNLQVPQQTLDSSASNPTAEKPGKEGAGDVKRQPESSDDLKKREAEEAA